MNRGYIFKNKLGNCYTILSLSSRTQSVIKFYICAIFKFYLVKKRGEGHGPLAPRVCRLCVIYNTGSQVITADSEETKIVNSISLVIKNNVTVESEGSFLISSELN